MNAERLDGLFKNEPFHLVQRSLSRQQSSNGSMMEENEERVEELRDMMNQILYSYGNTIAYKYDNVIHIIQTWYQYI